MVHSRDLAEELNHGHSHDLAEKVNNAQSQQHAKEVEDGLGPNQKHHNQVGLLHRISNNNLQECGAVLFGFLLAYGEIILGLASGDDAIDAIWPHAVRSLEWTMMLRQSHATVFTILILAVLVMGFTQNVPKTHPQRHRLDLILNAMIGGVLGFISIHFLMDIFYLRGAFLLLPTLMGWWLGMLLLARGGVPTWRQAHSRQISLPRITHLLGVFFAAWLVMPGVPAVLGFAPAPPSAPTFGYGSSPGPFETVSFAIPYIMPQQVVEVQGQLEQDIEFSIYLALPVVVQDGSIQNIPLALLLHGFGYPDVNAYQAWIGHLSAKGMAVAFIQYPSDIRPPGHASFEEIEADGMSNFLQHEYRNLAIRAAIAELEVSVLGEGRDERINETLGDITVDPSSLWLGGHSLGGAYTFLSLDEALRRGWGSKAMVVALEAPALRPMQSGLQPNLTGLPAETLVQISVSSDDMSVGMCPGAFHQQQFSMLESQRNQFIVVQSDKYGFPRLVASHYLPTDPAHDSLADWAFYRRLDAQADYVVAWSRNDTITADFAFHYLTDMSTLTMMGNWEDGTPVLPLKVYHDALHTASPFTQCS